MRETGSLRGADDKAKSKVGNPGEGIATSVKARGGNKVIAPVDTTATTAAPQGAVEASVDHDFGNANITPSVILQIVPLPRQLSDSRVTGQVTVNVMDTCLAS